MDTILVLLYTVFYEGLDPLKNMGTFPHNSQSLDFANFKVFITLQVLQLSQGYDKTECLTTFTALDHHCHK